MTESNWVSQVIAWYEDFDDYIAKNLITDSVIAIIASIYLDSFDYIKQYLHVPIIMINTLFIYVLIKLYKTDRKVILSSFYNLLSLLMNRICCI